MAFKMKGSAFKLGNVATKSALKQTTTTIREDNLGIKKNLDLDKKMNISHIDPETGQNVWRHDDDVYVEEHGEKTRADFGDTSEENEKAWVNHQKRMTEILRSKWDDDKKAEYTKNTGRAWDDYTQN